MRMRSRHNPESPAGIPSNGAIKFLQKLAKSGKGEIPIAELFEVARLLNWNITTAVLPMAFHTPGNAAEKLVKSAMMRIERELGSMKRYVGGHGKGFRVATGMFDRAYSPTTVVGTLAQRNAAAEAVNTRLAESFAVLPRGRLPPPEAEDDAIYLRGFEIDRDRDEGAALVAEAWVGAPAYIISAPGATPFILWREFRMDRATGARGVEYATLDRGGFWTWAYKVAGAQASATATLASLDADELAERTRPASASTLDHTGTCQICQATQKLSDPDGTLPVMVDHGYQHEKTTGHRPSYGHLGERVGRCFGVGAVPWELGHDRLDEYLRGAVRELESLSGYLARLGAGDVTSISEILLDRKTGRHETIFYTTAHPEWKWKLREEISRVDSDVHWLTTDAEMARKRIAGWKRKPLYDELQAAKGRPVAKVPSRRVKR